MNIYYLCIIGVFIISTICGFLFIPIILNFCKAKHLYDLPSSRKIHNKAVSRLGGVSFIPSMLISFAVAMYFMYATSHVITVSLWSFYFLIGILIIYAMGIIDDILGLTPPTKFLVQIVAACILPVSGLYINNLYGFFGIYEIPYIVGYPLTVFVIVFIDNAINLIDGIDGLAASLSILALCGFICIFSSQQAWAYSILISGLIGVIVAFLYFNLFGNPEKNRKIFMGDSGSLTLGYILGFLCVKYVMEDSTEISQHDFNFYMVFTLFLVPLFDVVRVFFLRIRHHKSPFNADKSHIHHKFLKAGFTQHKTLICILAFQAFYIVFNHFMLIATTSTVVCVIDILIYVVVNYMLNYLIVKRDIQSQRKR
ncbi:MAG: undecaprenyl/decaprenyl-phosphate alpha-N-acetylglucosaminyl 1-phosphate transferase [Prevotella sp.]|nr:undecaprenyl/decaprenyl-phosphate alpha-N-acetylglucosaminyl 1-phosphate transferase [Prevotella sp.]